MQSGNEDNCPLGVDESNDAIAFGSSAWRDAFRTQLTAVTLAQVLRHAEILIEGLDGLICASLAEDLVQDAIVATQQGSAVWKPHRVSLRRHLADHVEASLMRQRARPNRTVSIDEVMAGDDVDDDDGSDSSAFERDHLSVPPDGGRSLDLRRLSRETELVLWRLFGNDQRAMNVLNCYAVGVTAESEMISMIGATPAEIAAARKRIWRALDQMSHSLAVRVREALG